MRVVGPDGAQSVRLAKEKTTGEYDVIVDEAPSSPNQKDKTWAMLVQMAPLLTAKGFGGLAGSFLCPLIPMVLPYAVCECATACVC